MKIRCIICNSTDQWENVDNFKIKKTDMSICKCCGFVTHLSKIGNTEELKEHYRDDYRGGKAPGINNVFTGQRKLQYHAEFLNHYIREHKDKKLEICEIGSAHGMFLNWIKSVIPKATIYGTELTRSFRRCAFHEYGITLNEEFDKSKKYDLICSYKVAEHIPDIDKRLRENVECLKEGGHIYISVPTWFGTMENFGLAGFDLEYYYHPDHINVWTEAHFEGLLKRCGLKVIKKNNVTYGSTYLCQRDDSLMTSEVVKINPEEIKVTMGRMQKAVNSYNEGDIKKAIESYPDFPSAYFGLYESQRKQLHDLGFDKIVREFLEPFAKNCPKSFEFYAIAADIYMRYEKYEEAIKHIETALKIRNNTPQLLLNLSQCYRQLSESVKDEKEKIKFLVEAKNVTLHLRNISLQHRDEATNWIYADMSKIPMAGE